eukprot:TRINITY_DN225_c0_g1_i9.p1 TRINITY_DN225_c0_g1~~TRINITY_DN225_c0_g1_i9.p1  ORF type:complete len:149 (+),score=23.20 TRINITY_DN225_c0_g1_i9:351-797(+)
MDIMDQAKEYDIICWQETHTDPTMYNQETCQGLEEKFIIIHRPLTEEEKEEKRIQNKATKQVNSEGIMTFISRRMQRYLRILNIQRRYIAIALAIDRKYNIIIINVYAPVDTNENKEFWKEIDQEISKYKVQCQGKSEIIIVGDFNAK